MSYAVDSPAPKKRPATVTGASSLLYIIAAIQFVSIGLSFLSFGPVRQVLDEEFAGTAEGDTVETVLMVGIVVAVVVSAVFVVGALVLGRLVGKGKNPARIVTWVLAGIGALCYGCGLAGSAVSESLAGMGSAEADTTEIERRIEEVTPSWQPVVGMALNVVLLLLLVTVIILLALPASNGYFRKEQEVWVPPTLPAGGGGYPFEGGGTPFPPPPGPPTGPPR